jgi:hypothetical protein
VLRGVREATQQPIGSQHGLVHSAGRAPEEEGLWQDEDTRTAGLEGSTAPSKVTAPDTELELEAAAAAAAAAVAAVDAEAGPMQTEVQVEDDGPDAEVQSQRWGPHTIALMRSWRK